MFKIKGPRKPTNANADIIFLVDSSSTVPQSSYQIEKDFVKQISKYLNVEPGQSRAAYISYGDQSRTAFTFNGYNSYPEYERLVDSAPYVGGQRRMDRALDAASTLLGETRPSAPKIVVLLTAGRQSLGVNGRLLHEAAGRLRDKGAKTYVVAIGAGPNKNELRGAVDRPEDIIPVRSFNKLIPKAPPISRELAGGSGESVLAAVSDYRTAHYVVFKTILYGFRTAMEFVLKSARKTMHLTVRNTVTVWPSKCFYDI